MSLVSDFDKIKGTIPEDVKLVSVSKTKPNADILELYEHGVRIFGENKVQELAQKHEDLPKDIEWHYIGHLQSNKIKFIAPFVSLIHAVDSLKLLKAINKEALKNNRVIPVLMQLHIADEDTKFGLDLDKLKEILSSDYLIDLKNVEIVGLMGMATYTDDENQVKQEFQFLKSCFDELKATFFVENESFLEISMGMSGDYDLAIDNGSTMVRLGSSIFGERNYKK